MFPVPPLKFRTSGFPQYGFKLELNRNLRHRQHNLNARHICITLTMTYMQLKSWSLFLVILTDNLTIAELTVMTIQSRDPWLSCGLCCPTGSSLTMVSSETLDPLTALFSSSSKSLPYYLVWAGIESFPNLPNISFPSCYILYPGALNDCFRLLLRRLHWLSPCSDRLSLRIPNTLVLVWAD